MTPPVVDTSLKGHENRENEATRETRNNQTRFRSVLPHEPLPSDSKGYLHVQGSFEPRIEANTTELGTSDDDIKEEYWTKSSLENGLLEALNKTTVDSSAAPQHLASSIQSVEVLDPHAHPFTKVRLTLDSPQAARELMSVWRSAKVTPANLLHSNDNGDNIQFSTRPLQVTQVTTQPLLSSDISWPRSNPPKFRRLLARPGEDLKALEEERAKTRFVFMTGLLADDNSNTIPPCWNNPFVAVEAIRKVMNEYDTSGLGVEVFVSAKKQVRACHVGMRSPVDANTLITTLQGQQVKWHLPTSNTNGSICTVQSGKLFLDYADITKRSYSRSQNPDESARGEPSRSECTSLTAHVIVPGLVLVPDFVSEREETALVAVLTGPQAPWAPPQSTPSMSGNVKRRVQHYGYVFDYETANVLRDRTQQGADCPPMPAIPSIVTETGSVEKYIESSVSEGRGWEALAGIIERTRDHDFSSDASTDPVRFRSLNQMTVNEYREGSGIGSHVDTRTAFGDGLISLSLNSGIVMEFRQTNEERQ